MPEGGRPGPSTLEIPLPGGQPPQNGFWLQHPTPQLAPAPRDTNAAGLATAL